jgi:uncharacterized membrane protein SpoIIM required for sporulation
LVPNVAFEGAVKVNTTVSLPSKTVSCSTGIFTVWLVTPAAKVTVKGEPMAVYKSSGEIGMFLGITINNIRVGIFAFAMGILFSVGTIYVLFSNGIMLGAFITFFYNYGVLEKTSTVWLHGTIEISVIVIAGCAGLVMGNSFLFPKTYSRRVSFMKGAKDGLKIIVSTFPFFIIAGFIEGFITRYGDNMHWIISYSIILASAALISYYYIFYPIILNRKLKIN